MSWIYLIKGTVLIGLMGIGFLAGYSSGISKMMEPGEERRERVTIENFEDAKKYFEMNLCVDGSYYKDRSGTKIIAYKCLPPPEDDP